MKILPCWVFVYTYGRGGQGNLTSMSRQSSSLKSAGAHGTPEEMTPTSHTQANNSAEPELSQKSQTWSQNGPGLGLVDSVHGDFQWVLRGHVWGSHH
jgi:hypothetical protein